MSVTARAEPPAHVLAPEAGLSLTDRVGEASTGYPIDRRLRGGYRLGGSWGMSRSFTLGLFYERSGAGREEIAYADTGYASSTSRSLHAVIADLRVFALRSASTRLFVELDAGFSLEAVEQSGVRLDPGPKAYRCTASSGPSALLGVAVGGEVELGGSFALVGRAFGVAHRLGDAPLSDGAGLPCAPGAGSLAQLGASLGLAYRFDLGS